jgi:hypothetical protein
MSVIVLAWGLHRKLASRFILGPVSFLAITHTLFFCKRMSEEVSKYIELFWATIHQITSYWGNMTSRKEYYASRDASKVYLFYCFTRWRAYHFCLCFPMIYIPTIYILKLLLKVFGKRIQEGLDISPNIAAIHSLHCGSFSEIAFCSPLIEVLMTIKFSLFTFLIHYRYIRTVLSILFTNWNPWYN